MDKAIIDTLKATNSSKEKLIVYPRTVFEAVSDTEGISLDKALERIYQNMNVIASEITNVKKSIIVLENSINNLSSNNVVYICNDQIYIERFEQGESYLEPITFLPYKYGWIFRGWRKDTEASGNVLLGEDKVMNGQPLTLYGVFVHTIYISYNGNGDDIGNMISTDTITQYYNSKGNYSNAEITLPPGDIFTKTGYTFSKWAIGSVNGTQYDAGEKVFLTDNTMFYAIWTKNDINYLIQNNVSSYNINHSTHKATTDISQSLTYSVNNNGQQVILKNNSVDKDIDIYIKFPLTTASYLGRLLNISGNLKCNNVNMDSDKSNSALYLAVFDSSDNIVNEQYIVGCYANPEYNKTNETFKNSLMQLPSSGDYYIGYKIRVGGCCGNEFELNISEFFIQ